MIQFRAGDIATTSGKGEAFLWNVCNVNYNGENEPRLEEFIGYLNGIALIVMFEQLGKLSLLVLVVSTTRAFSGNYVSGSEIVQVLDLNLGLVYVWDTCTVLA